MPVLRLFAAAREAAGVARAEFDGTTVAELLAAAETSFGGRFSAVLAQSRVWVNGEPATAETPVSGHDVVAVLPPVSGGAGDVALAPHRAAPDPAPARHAGPDSAPPRPAGPGGAREAVTRPDRGPVRRTDSARPVGARDKPRPDARGWHGGPVDSPEPAGEAAPASQSRRPEAGQSSPGGSLAAGALVDAGPRPTSPGGPPERGTRPERPAPVGTRSPKPGAAAPLGSSALGTATVPDKWWAPLARFGVVYDNTRPHGRIGLVWAMVTVGATVAGPTWIAGWLGVGAFVGASQAAGTRRALDTHPPPWLAALASLGPPVAAVFGGRYVVGMVAAGLGSAILVRTFVNHQTNAQNVSLALVIGMATGSAAAAVALTRQVDVAAAVYLLACACIYDAGAYLVGTGASAAWEGPLAGVVALIPVTILAAVVLVPPFPSGTPLALGLLAAVLAPLGPLAGTALLGRRDADAPGLRRLDSLIFLGPAWAWLISTILH